MEIKYPNQVAKIARNSKTIGIDAFLETPNVGSGQSPLEMHAGYSRFKVTILESVGGKYGSVAANIPADEIPLVLYKTQMAINEYNNKSAEESSPDDKTSAAYTVSLYSSKEFKGKTPAEVLTLDPNNKEKLESLKKLLNDNIGKYPNNKTQIEAIDDAINLLTTGKLIKSVSTTKTIDVYRADIRVPHAKKLDENGLTDVYSFSIVCDTSKDYPFIVNIMNCKAPIKTLANGASMPDMNNAKFKKQSNIMLTESEWYKTIYKLNRIKDLFEENKFNEMLKISKENSYSYKV